MLLNLQFPDTPGRNQFLMGICFLDSNPRNVGELHFNHAYHSSPAASFRIYSPTPWSHLA